MFRKASIATLLLATVCSLNLAAAQTADPPETPAPVDINTASVDQILEVVRDEALAEKIVEGRPWANKRQLLSRNLVTAEEYERIQARIVARRVQTAP